MNRSPTIESQTPVLKVRIAGLLPGVIKTQLRAAKSCLGSMARFLKRQLRVLRKRLRFSRSFKRQMRAYKKRLRVSRPLKRQVRSFSKRLMVSSALKTQALSFKRRRVLAFRQMPHKIRPNTFALPQKLWLSSARTNKPQKSRLATIYRPPDPAMNPMEGVRTLLNEATDPLERSFCEHVLDTFDFKAHAEIQAKHLARAPGSGVKWLDFAHYLQLRYQYVIDLGLHSSEPLQILDIGCGPAHFGYICQYFGHNTIGLDVPGGEVFNDLVALLGVERISTPIRPATPLPPTPRFDYVTAWHATFFSQKRGMFTLAEWKFFFDDLVCNHMKPMSRLHFLLNKKWDRSNPSDRAFIHFIEAHGGGVDDRRVIFDSLMHYPSACLTPAKLLETGDAEAIADGIRVMLEAGDTDTAARLADESRGVLLGYGKPAPVREGVRALVEAGHIEKAAGLAEQARDALDGDLLRALSNIGALRAA